MRILPTIINIYIKTNGSYGNNAPELVPIVFENIAENQPERHFSTARCSTPSHEEFGVIYSKMSNTFLKF